jgi:L-lactate utilization protein LutB
MDDNLKFINQKRIEKTIDALEKNNMNGYYVKSKEELISKIEEIVKDGATVSVGGSMTLFETGIIDYLRSGKYNFLDRYENGLKPEDIKEIFRKTFYADAYFTSSNAITENGELYNVDGTGNRIAAITFGPDKVIVIAGVNKIVKDLDEARQRVKYVAAPANAKRLNRATPCTKVGHCMDCKSEQRICLKYSVMSRQSDKERIHVIFLNEQFGY